MKNKRIRRSPDEARALLTGAARDALVDADFATLTVASVTARAGMTRSAFYHYFSGLDELVLSLLEEFENAIRAAVDGWLDGDRDSEDYRRAMFKELSTMFAVFDEHRTVVRALTQAASSSHQVLEQWQARAIDYYIDKTTRFIVRQVALGRSRVDDPRRTARALILMNNSVGFDNMLRPDPDDPAMVARTISDIWNATIYGPKDS